MGVDQCARAAAAEQDAPGAGLAGFERAERRLRAEGGGFGFDQQQRLALAKVRLVEGEEDVGGGLQGDHRRADVVDPAEVLRALVVILMVVTPAGVVAGEVELGEVAGAESGGAGRHRVAEGESVVVHPDGDFQAGLGGTLELEDRLTVAVGHHGALSPERLPAGVVAGRALADELPVRAGQRGIADLDRRRGRKQQRLAEGLEAVAEGARVIEARFDVELLIRAVDRDHFRAD